MGVTREYGSVSRKRIHVINPRSGDVPRIPRGHRKTVLFRGCGKQAVYYRQWIWNVQSTPFLCDVPIHVQNPIFKAINQSLQPPV